MIDPGELAADFVALVVDDTITRLRDDVNEVPGGRHLHTLGLVHACDSERVVEGLVAERHDRFVDGGADVLEPRDRNLRQPERRTCGAPSAV